MKIRGNKLAAALLACGLIAASVGETAAAAEAARPVTVLLDDVAMTFDGVEPQIKSNYTFVPFRPLAEAMGIEVVWHAASKSITARGGSGGEEKTVVLTVDKTQASVNGKTVTLAAAPYVVNGRTLIPLSFFSTQFGAEVGWDGTTRMVTIVSPAREMHIRGFYAIRSFPERDRIADMNSVAFGWIRVDENGELTTSGKDYYWPEASGDITPEKIISDASEQGAAPYLMVYSVDGNGELTRMLSDPSLRSRSIDQIVSLAKGKGFAGVQLDFEGLGLKLDPLEQQKLLNDYVRLLADQLKPEGIQLSLAVPPPNSAYKGYDYSALAGLADDLVIMAYEYHAAGTPDHTPQPNAKE